MYFGVVTIDLTDGWPLMLSMSDLDFSFWRFLVVSNMVILEAFFSSYYDVVKG